MDETYTMPAASDNYVIRRLKDKIEELRHELERARAERDKAWDEAQRALESHRFLEEMANRLFPLVKGHTG